MTQLVAYRRTADRLLAEYNRARANVRAEKDALAEAEQKVAACIEAQQIIQNLAQTVQAEAHKQIASVVSRCLQAVFEEAYVFKIDFKRARGKTEARLLFVRDGIEIDPLSAAGGGVIDVAAFALRLACLMLARPSQRRLLVLDEPFRFLSAGYRPRVKALLETLAKDLDVQIVMVTHVEELQTGTVIDLA